MSHKQGMLNKEFDICKQLESCLNPYKEFQIQISKGICSWCNTSPRYKDMKDISNVKKFIVREVFFMEYIGNKGNNAYTLHCLNHKLIFNQAQVPSFYI